MEKVDRRGGRATDKRNGNAEKRQRIKVKDKG